MRKYLKIHTKILSGLSDKNIGFDDLRNLLLNLHFEERIKGSHHIFTHEKTEEIINIQSKAGKAKAYQVRQVRNILIKYKLKL